VKALKDDPFKGAPCVSEGHQQWMVENRGASRWDYVIPGESERQQAIRRASSVRVCKSCPALKACEELHATFERIDGHRPSQIWAGKVYSEKLPKLDNVDMPPLPTYSRDELEAA
jgi:hypothetical protein